MGEFGIFLFWAWVAYYIVLYFRAKRRKRMLEVAPSLYSDYVDSRFWKRYFITLFVFMPLLWVASGFLAFWEWSPLPEAVKGVFALVLVVILPAAFPLSLAIAWVWNSWMCTSKPWTHGETPRRSVDPLTGKVTVKHKSRKERRKAREFALKSLTASAGDCRG